MTDPWLPNDVARCPGRQAEGEWREGCEDCLRRTAPPSEGPWDVFMPAPPMTADGCEYRIAP